MRLGYSYDSHSQLSRGSTNEDDPSVGVIGHARGCQRKSMCAVLGREGSTDREGRGGEGREGHRGGEEKGIE